MCLSRALAWTVCVSMALPSAVTGAEQPPLPQSLPKTVAVAAFKNGLAFLVRQGAVQLQSGTGTITPIPNATLGTLWLAPGEANTSLDEVVAYRYNVSAERPLQSIAEVLQANAGKTVTITYSMNMKDYTGEIVGVRDSKPAPGDLGTENAPIQPRHFCQAAIPVAPRRQKAPRLPHRFHRKRGPPRRHQFSGKIRTTAQPPSASRSKGPAKKPTLPWVISSTASGGRRPT